MRLNLFQKDTKKHIDVSRLFIYYNARRIDGMEDYNMQDTGTQIKNGIESFQRSLKTCF